MVHLSWKSFRSFYLPVLIATLLWGSGAPSIKLCYQAFGIGPDQINSQLFFAGTRFVLSGVLTLGFALARGLKIIPERRQLIRLVLFGLFQTGLYYGLYFYSVANIPAVAATVLCSTNVFFTIGIAHVTGMERCTFRRMTGCLLAFVGVVVIALSGGTGDAKSSVPALIIMLVAAAIDGVSRLIGKKIMVSVEPLITNGWQLLSGGLLLTAIGAVTGGPLPVPSVSAAAGWFYLAFLSAAALSIWLDLMHRYSIGKVTVCSFLTPIFGMMFAALLLPGEHAFTLMNALAILMICGGLLLVNTHQEEQLQQ